VVPISNIRALPRNLLHACPIRRTTKLILLISYIRALLRLLLRACHTPTCHNWFRAHQLQRTANVQSYTWSPRSTRHITPSAYQVHRSATKPHLYVSHILIRHHFPSTFLFQGKHHCASVKESDSLPQDKTGLFPTTYRGAPLITLIQVHLIITSHKRHSSNQVQWIVNDHDSTYKSRKLKPKRPRANQTHLSATEHSNTCRSHRAAILITLLHVCK
jgi:hypothetical protein